jgi:hypothetical protein
MDRLEEIICCNFRVNRIQVQPGRRNDSAIIRAFLKAITFATLLNGGVVYALVTYSSVHSVRNNILRLPPLILG